MGQDGGGKQAIQKTAPQKTGSRAGCLLRTGEVSQEEVHAWGPEAISGASTWRIQLDSEQKEVRHSLRRNQPKIQTHSA